MNILIIGMLNSIHTFKWLKRFENSGYNFYLYPSRQYRRVHPEIKLLLKNNTASKFTVVSGLPLFKFSIVDFIFSTKKFLNIDKFNRTNRLIRVLIKYNFDVIHAIEIQNSGYLLLGADKYIDKRKTKLFLTNLGSDIYFYQKNKSDREKIIKLLKKVDYYSAECERDFKLAKLYGYKGKFGPCLPNAASFSNQHFKRIESSTLKRNRVMIKTYGEKFGLGKISIAVASELLNDSKYSYLTFTFYSVTDDLIESLKKLKFFFPNRIEIFTVRKPADHTLILKRFAESILYIGCSKSDGISTSFLEAISSGCYPIQSNTSCASEWLKLGIKASILKPDFKSYLNETYFLLKDRVLLEKKTSENLFIAKTKLLDLNINRKLVNYYSMN